MDAVLLALHGAMVTESDDDAEGLVLQRVRDRMGADIPVVVTLDLHAHVTQRMVDHATAHVIYKTCTRVCGLYTLLRNQKICLSFKLVWCLWQTHTLTAVPEQSRQSE